MILTSPAASEEVRQFEAGGDNGHEDEKLDDRKQRNDEFEAGRDTYAKDIDGHEDEVGEDRSVSWREIVILDVKIGSDGESDGRWGKYKLYECSCGSDVTAGVS